MKVKIRNKRKLENSPICGDKQHASKNSQSVFQKRNQNILKQIKMETQCIKLTEGNQSTAKRKIFLAINVDNKWC